MAKNPEAKPGSLDSQYDCSIIWRHVAPAGITLDHCQRPDYWRNVIREVGQQRVPGRHSFNRIEILAEDGTWEAELRVMSVDQGLVQTRLLREWKAAGKPGRKPALPDGYEIEHLSNAGWRALDPNGGIVTTGKTTEEAALREAAAHAKRGLVAAEE